MKKSKYFIIIGAVLLVILAIVAILLITARRKGIRHELAQTNYPISWTEEKDGSVSVKLDGRFKPDYTWKAVSDDDTLLEIKEGKEKNGIVTYRIKPIAEGNASVEFIRFRETEEIPVPEPPTEEESSEDLKPEDIEPEEENSEIVQEPDYVPSGSMLMSTDEEGNTVEVPLFSGEDVVVYKDENIPESNSEEIYQPEDVVCRFTLNFTNTLKGKNKFIASTAPGEYYEGEGLIIGAHGERIFRKSDSEFMVLLPPCLGLWLENTESKFSGNFYQELDEYGNIREEVILPSPEFDENGNAIILRVSRAGIYRDYTVFTVTGLGEGTATVTFSSPDLKIRTTINLTIDRYGTLTMESYTFEEYKPTAAEIEAGIGDMVKEK